MTTGCTAQRRAEFDVGDWCQEAKLDPKTVQEMLRHSKVQTTLEL